MMVWGTLAYGHVNIDNRKDELEKLLLTKKYIRKQLLNMLYNQLSLRSCTDEGSIRLNLTPPTVWHEGDEEKRTVPARLRERAPPPNPLDYQR